MLIFSTTWRLALLWVLISISYRLYQLDANLSRLDELPTTKTIVIPVPPPDLSKMFMTPRDQ